MGKHYVPQEYLRGFASDSEARFIWMFDKETQAWVEPAIKTVAQQRAYYSAETEERLAREVETPGHQALNTIRKGGSITSGEREAFALYLAVLIMRVPRKRRQAAELAPRVLAGRMTETTQDLSELRTAENATRIDAIVQELERIEARYREELPATIREVIESPWPSALVLSAVQTMNWRVVAAPNGQFFITSDTPAHYFDSLGLGTDDAELTVPLSRYLVLLGSNQGSPGGLTRVTGKPALVKEVNRRIAFGAERFVFTPRREDWVQTIALRTRPNLSRIVWDEPV